MEEKKKGGATGLVLCVILIAAIVIALLWFVITNLNAENAELKTQIDSLNSRSITLEAHILRLEKAIESNTDIVIDNTVEDVEENEDEVDNTVVDEENTTVRPSEVADDEINVSNGNTVEE